MAQSWSTNNCPSLSIDVGFSYQLTSGSDTAWHSHSFCEIFVVVSGEIDHQYGGKAEHLSVGDCRFIFPNIPHQFIRTGPCTHRDYEIQTDFFNSVLKMVDPDLFSKTSLFAAAPGFRLSLTEVAFLEEQMTFFSYATKSSDREKFAQFITYYLLSLYSTHKASESLQEDPFKRDCLAIIDREFYKKDACVLIRSHFGYNDKYFCDKFRRSFGQTLVEYLNHKRIDYAHYLLLSSDKSIEEICYAIGFSSSSYFRTLYERKYGETPLQTRKTNFLKQFAHDAAWQEGPKHE
jgi:AraC-like DNA-binding protein